ncbi:MAG: glycosyltransferase family 9 protein [Defluviimonas sp.]|uniref:glycosyltransferase family 9 protein n=1 Tax=Albidovulum sp. TaxID=1872424 RepID=UPI002A2DF969|nr:glycosyltransferase family 9 protein [Defluviimonas sp.]
MADRAAFETAARLFDRIDGLGHPLRGKPTGPDQPKRILIWTVDRIGDVVRGTLSVAALRRQFPHAEIVVVVANRALAVLAHNKAIDRIITIASPHSLADQRAGLAQLRGEHFDLGVLLEVEYFWVKLGQMWFRWLGVDRWARFDHGLARHPRETLVPIDPAKGWDALFADLAVAAGADATGLRPTITLADTAREGARKRLLQRGLDIEGPFLLCHPGTSALVIDRSWEAEKFGAVIRELHRETGLRTIVTGLPAETPLARTIVRVAGEPAAVDLTGLLSLEELMATIDAADLLLINDTGPLHIANALATPAVAVLGPTAPSVLGLDPDLVTLVHSALPCQPCAYHAGLKGCTNPEAYACLRAVTVEQVRDAALARLRRSPTRETAQ